MCNANLYKNTTNYFKVLKYMFFSTKKKKHFSTIIIMPFAKYQFSTYLFEYVKT